MTDEQMKEFADQLDRRSPSPSPSPSPFQLISQLEEANDALFEALHRSIEYELELQKTMRKWRRIAVTATAGFLVAVMCAGWFALQAAEALRLIGGGAGVVR